MEGRQYLCPHHRSTWRMGQCSRPSLVPRFVVMRAKALFVDCTGPGRPVTPDRPVVLREQSPCWNAPVGRLRKPHSPRRGTDHRVPGLIKTGDWSTTDRVAVDPRLAAPTNLTNPVRSRSRRYRSDRWHPRGGRLVRHRGNVCRGVRAWRRELGSGLDPFRFSG